VLVAGTIAASTRRFDSRSVACADYFEVVVDKDVVGPVDADVVDLVVAAAQFHDSIDDAARVGQQGGFGGFVRGGSAEDGAGSVLVAGRDLTNGFDLSPVPLKATTWDAVLELGSGGPTMTSVAVIVVLSSVPSTRTVTALVTALFDVAVVPFSYLVDDVSLMVTFPPVGVDRVKPDADKLLTLPIDPPAAGPDRALDPPPADWGCPDVAVVDVVLLELPELVELPQAAISTPVASTVRPSITLCAREEVILRRVMSGPFGGWDHVLIGHEVCTCGST
jgi:hypothetical protein